MKVAVLNTNDVRGGAARAAFRLTDMLRKSNVDAQMLVLEKKSSESYVYPVYHQKWRQFIQIRLDKYYLKLSGIKQTDQFSTGKFGSNLINHKIIKEADVIHLHWFNRGLFSIQQLAELVKWNKPIVFTLHDMWFFTGGCHYSNDCIKYLSACNACPVIHSDKENDISNKVWKAKKKIYSHSNFQVLTPSRWMTATASASSLLQPFHVKTLPNPINTEIFKPLEKKSIRQKLGISEDKKILLFGVENVNDERKGFHYIKTLLENIQGYDASYTDKIELLIFGNNTSATNELSGFKIHNTGYISGEKSLVEVYNCADLYIQASLEDNLPNTAVEAISCGLPVLAFNQGGMSDIVKHKENGYLAEFKSTEDFEKGLLYVLGNLGSMSDMSRKYALRQFSYEALSTQFIELYQSLAGEAPKGVNKQKL